MASPRATGMNLCIDQSKHSSTGENLECSKLESSFYHTRSHLAGPSFSVHHLHIIRFIWQVKTDNYLQWVQRRGQDCVQRLLAQRFLQDVDDVNRGGIVDERHEQTQSNVYLWGFKEIKSNKNWQRVTWLNRNSNLRRLDYRTSALPSELSSP